MNKFILDVRYGELLSSYVIGVEEALLKEELLGDVFQHKSPVMKDKEY